MLTFYGLEKTFNDELLQEDFCRFNVYAPYVKRLVLFKRQEDIKRITRWGIIMDYVRAGHVLLPNLTTLSLEQSFGEFPALCPFIWISIFCSPALKTLVVSEQIGLVSSQMGSELFRMLANTCPDLSTLKVDKFDVLVHDSGLDHLAEYISNEAKERDCIPNLLQPNSAIQELTVPLSFVEKYISYIGGMENLERLKVWDSEERGSDSVATPMQLPQTPFPALKALEFSEIHPLMIESICNRIPSLVAGVTTLSCMILTEEESEWYNGPSIGFLLRFVTILTSCSPAITELTIHFDAGDEREDSFSTTLDERSLQVLAKLPLKKLCVHAVLIEPYVELDDYTGACELIASTFPNLETLVWIPQEASYSDLTVFLNMPNLRYLGICLGDICVTSTSELTAKPEFRRPLRVLEVDLMREYQILGGGKHRRTQSDWFNFARYIARFWPKVKLVPIHRYSTGRTRISKARLSQAWYNRINKFLKLVREKDLRNEQELSSLWECVAAN